jgi:hypothetical protein
MPGPQKGDPMRQIQLRCRCGSTLFSGGTVTERPAASRLYRLAGLVDAFMAGTCRACGSRVTDTAAGVQRGEIRIHHH